MPRIETLEIRQGRRLKLDVSSTIVHRDLDLLGHQIENIDTDLIYDADSNQATQRPAAVLTDNDECWLTVKISGIASELLDKRLLLVVDPTPSASFYSKPLRPNEDSKTIDDTAVFEMVIRGATGADQNAPWCHWGLVGFSLHVVEELGSSGPSIYEKQIPLELYILQYPLPQYFKKGVPLLLLRMFVAAATAKGVATAQDWVAMVVNICHGSVAPISGEPANTKDHWLKYNSVSGGSSFVLANHDLQPQKLTYPNYGGDFQLSAWLNAYCNFKSKGALTLVNCYDQAASVEIALSLGINYNSVAWEYHQKFGFISRAAELVGWGSCNSPYFKKERTMMILPENDPNRTYFANHAFLSWNPDFHPETEKDFFEENDDPSEYIKVKMLAIDACAGPHLGNEERGSFVHPAEYPADYADKSTYWRSRDDKYDRLRFDQELLSTISKEEHHNWTPGVTGLSNLSVGLNASFKSLQSRDPFQGSGIMFPDYGSLPSRTRVLSGNCSDLQGHFQEDAIESGLVEDHWELMPIEDIKLESNIQRESKLYVPESSEINYFSLRVTTTSSPAEALDILKARAAQVVITSNLEAKDFSTNIRKGVYMLQADYASLLLYLNIVLEVNGLVSKAELEPLVDRVVSRLAELPVDDSGNWRAFLD